GLVSGYAGGWIDDLIMRITDAMLAIPFLIVAIALAAFLGPSLTNAMIAIGIAALPVFLRLARNTVLTVKAEEYVEAARALGGSRARRLALPDRRARHSSEHAAAAGDPVEPDSRRGDHRRGESLVPGPGPAAAGAVVGQHAERGPALSVAGAVDGALSGSGDLRDRPGAQRARRRAARRSRSQVPLTNPLTNPGETVMVRIIDMECSIPRSEASQPEPGHDQTPTAAQPPGYGMANYSRIFS